MPIRNWTGGTQRVGALESDSVSTDEATIDGNRVYIQSTAPSNPSDNDIWFDLP